MAKSIIVDFRGGLNNKISGHTIGETQGQDMTNVDLALVRLEGREQLNPAEKANGSYFYEPGNLADAFFQGRWVSIYAEDDTGTATTPYHQYATDFALWNKDLYVTFGIGHSDGQLRVFRDGAQTAETINFNSPGTSTFTTSNATSTSENLATSETLVNQVTGQTGSPAQTVTVTTGNASQFNPPYTQGSTDSARNRVIWTQGTTNYYQNPNPITSGGSEYTIQSETSATTTTVLSWVSAYWISANNQGGQQIVDSWSCNYVIKSISSSSVELRQGSFGGSFSNTFINAHNYWVGRSPASAGLPSSGPLVVGNNAHQSVYSNSVAGHSVNDYRIHGISSSTVGTVTSVQWHSVTNQTNPSSSSPTAITLHGSNFSNTLQVGANFSLSLYFQRVQGTQQTNYTFSDRTDTIPAVASIPSTPAFTYDNARQKLYKQYASDSDVGAEDEDTARGYNWLATNRAVTLTEHGYYLRTVRQSNYLPQLSVDQTKATTTEALVLDNQLNLLNTPQRLNFSIALPADHSSTNTATPLVAYKLERRDNTATVDLGYIAPESVFASSAYGTTRNAVAFAYDSSNQQVSLSNLETGAAYRIKFYAYQDTFVTVGSNSAVKSNTVGVTFAGNSPPSITLVAQTGSPNADARFLAADFWLEKKVITGTNTSSEADDTYAVVRCFDVFDRNGNAVNTGAITGTSDFLDVFATGLSTGGLTTGTTQTAAPTYLLFLEEANNFFFAVGTDSTPPARYGGLNVNKSDSFLFVSEYNNPRNWPTEGYVEFESSITGLHSYPGELIVWTDQGVFRVTGSRHDQMRKSKLASTEGLPKNQERTIAQVGQYLVWVSQTGICAYNGESVVNITRGRLASLGLATGSQLHAAQFEDVYYVVDSTETGYAVDFSLQGFPISRIDLKEGSTTTPANAAGQTLPPVLYYRSSVNQLFSRRGVIRGGSSRLGFSYKSREFDGGAFGSLKLVRNVTINGTGSGTVQVFLDGKPVFFNSATPPVATPITVTIESGTRSEPARVHLPTTNTANTLYGLPVADTWSVEINWSTGKVDWIDTEYEVLTS